MKVFKIFFTIAIVTLSCGCASYHYSNKINGEKLEMSVINYEKPLTLRDAVEKEHNIASGAFVTTDMLVGGVSLAVKGVKKLISKSSNNYTSSYEAAMGQEYFYSGTSVNNALDPSNVQFKGFSIKRVFKEKKHDEELAMSAHISLDDSKLQELFLNSKFYFKMDSINVAYSRVKVNQSKWYTPWTVFMKNKRTINLDFEIVIKAKWMDKSGNIYSDREMGKFYLTLRNAPLNPNDDGYTEYYDSLRNKPLDGSSFIIPRSYASCINSKGEYQPCYGQGEFSIIVRITESSKDAFVNTFITTNSDEVLNQLNEKEIRKIFRKP